MRNLPSSAPTTCDTMSSTGPSNDASLMTAALGGDADARTQALAMIAMRYSDRLTRYAERLAPGHGEDIAQQVLVELVARRVPLRDGACLGSWLHGIARNMAMDVYRRRASAVGRAESIEALQEDGRVLPDATVDVPAQVEARADAAAVLAALGDLSEARRTTLALRLICGLTNTEIEEVRGVRGIKQEISRSLPMLREAYVRRSGCCAPHLIAG